MDYKKAFYALNKKPSEYVLRFALPLILVGVAIGVIPPMLFPGIFSGYISYILYTIPVYFLIIVLIYPLTIFDRKKRQIDQNMHLFSTHMGALSTTDLSGMQLMEILSEKKEYDALSEEIKKLFTLMKRWRMSLPEACRFIAKRAPSEIFSDFLDRLAHTVESGEEMKHFLKNEQSAIMAEFSAMYEDRLNGIDRFRDVIVSVTVSLIFMMCFAMILPMITGQDVTTIMMGCLFMFIFAEVVIAFGLKNSAPHDPIWDSTGIITEARRRIRKWFYISFICCFITAILALALYRAYEIPIPFVIAISVTPLVLGGWVIRKEERLVKRRDENYAAFIRSLGGAAAARCGSIEDVLRPLTAHDFGPLTRDISRLFKRIKTHINSLMAWELFSAETGSNLINRFTRMFTEAIYKGGNTNECGEIINNNFIELINLRRKRYHSTSTFTGISYGLMAGIFFTLYATLGITSMVDVMFSGFSLPGEIFGGGFLGTPVNIGMISMILACIMICYALISSIMIRFTDGGHLLNANIDFVVMMWIGAVVSLAAERMFSIIINF
jgi:flagellar protein FlaJ